MRKVFSFGVLAFLLFGMATFATAEGKYGGHHGKHDKMFEKKDVNSDGVISKTEFVTYSEGKFSKMDADGNGSLTEEEVKSYKKEKYKNRKKSGQCGDN